MRSTAEVYTKMKTNGVDTLTTTETLQMFRAIFGRRHYLSKKRQAIKALRASGILPDKRRNKTDNKVIAQILVKHPSWGAIRIRQELIRQGYQVSVSTVQRRINTLASNRKDRARIISNSIKRKQ